MPHLATPVLKAYLQLHGHQVTQRDLNVECMDKMLSRRYLQRAERAFKRRFRHLAPDSTPVVWVRDNAARLIAQVERAKGVMRSDAFYEGATGAEAFATLMDALELASLPYAPSRLDYSSFQAGGAEEVSDDLMRLVRSPSENFFYGLFEDGLVASIMADDPELVGISIPTQAQFLAGLTVAALLKKHDYKGHITVGGPHITMLREQIMLVPEILDVFDSAVVFEGEEPLRILAEQLEKDTPDFSIVPNLLYKDNERVLQTAYIAPIPMMDLPDPDFAGLPLELYLAPEPVLPLMTARGCYHGKCAFCNVGYGEENRFSQLSPERVVQQLVGVKEKYGVRHVIFGDEAITPRNFRHMSGLLTELGSPVHYATCARLDKTFSPELLQKMVQGGCRMLFYGLESASPRVSAHMVKGTSIDTMSRVLRDGAQAGLWNHVFFFFGFPTETMDEAQETVNFLYAHQDSIHSAGIGTFSLEKYSPAYEQPEQYGITRVVNESRRDLAIYFDYEVSKGLDENMAERVLTSLMQALPNKPCPQFYVHDVYRFLYACWLYERDEPYPLWLARQSES